jgi:hypothetical protein
MQTNSCQHIDCQWLHADKWHLVTIRNNTVCISASFLELQRQTLQMTHPQTSKARNVQMPSANKVTNHIGDIKQVRLNVNLELSQPWNINTNTVKKTESYPDQVHKGACPLFCSPLLNEDPTSSLWAQLLLKANVDTQIKAIQAASLQQNSRSHFWISMDPLVLDSVAQLFYGSHGNLLEHTEGSDHF